MPPLSRIPCSLAGSSMPNDADNPCRTSPLSMFLFIIRHFSNAFLTYLCHFSNAFSRHFCHFSNISRCKGTDFFSFMQELGHKKYANRELNSLFAYNSYSIYASVRSEFCQILRTKCNFSALSMQNLTSFAHFFVKIFAHVEIL